VYEAPPNGMKGKSMGKKFDVEFIVVGIPEDQFESAVSLIEQMVREAGYKVRMGIGIENEELSDES
jgi:hypothetical protein